MKTREEFKCFVRESAYRNGFDSMSVRCYTMLDNGANLKAIKRNLSSMIKNYEWFLNRPTNDSTYTVRDKERVQVDFNISRALLDFLMEVEQ